MVLDSTMRSLRVRLLLPLSLVVVVIVIGTAGYHVLWLDVGGTWMDALFMTVTTITTIGYGEIKPLTTAGRLFTMGLAITGIGSMFYTLGVVMEYLVSVRLADPMGRRRMVRRIRELAGHVIVAGMGRVGQQAALELHGAGTAFVVVDTDEPAIRHAAERGYLALVGDATQDEVLEQVGIRRARGLIVTTGEDATNIYIVLSARVLSPHLHIVARATGEAGVTKLARAGRQPGGQPLRDRRPPPRAPDAEPGGGGFLRDRAPARQRHPRHRGPGDAGGQSVRRPDARHPQHPPGHRRHRAGHPARRQPDGEPARRPGAGGRRSPPRAGHQRSAATAGAADRLGRRGLR